MAIIQTVNENHFIKEFDAFNRSDNFTIPARRALFEYYDQLSEDTGEPIELDCIAICCDWSECTERELFEEYGHIAETVDDILDELENRTTVIPVYWQGVAQNTYLIGPF